MFWRAKVSITEQMYRSSRPVIYLMRLLGLFPIAVRRDEGGSLYLQWSPIYAVYSYVLGVFLQSTAYMGMFKDLMADHKQSVRVRTNTDVFVNFGDVSGTEIVCFSGIFVVPLGFLTFFSYIQSINKADAILLTKHSKWEKLRKFLTCYGTLLAIATALTGDFLSYVATVSQNLSLFSIFKTYSTYYATCTILMITEYEFQFMAGSLRKRIKRLNTILEVFNSIGSERDYNRVVAWQKNKAVKRNGGGKRSKDPREKIGKLMEAYGHLVDAANHQNKLLGATGAVAIVAGYWHLITASYFLLSELGGKRKDPAFLAMKVAWCFFHTGRLLMVIEPLYATCVHTETTKNLVCKLHCTEIGRRIRKELKTFTFILALRKIEFSLAGLAVIDRALLTSVLSTTTTYLVILLQYQAEDKEN